jgi:hypothetical protein
MLSHEALKAVSSNEAASIDKQHCGGEAHRHKPQDNNTELYKPLPTHRLIIVIHGSGTSSTKVAIVIDTYT